MMKSNLHKVKGLCFTLCSSESWDCVATCFFIDTAHNVLEYMETIWKILKPGGVWINLGELVFGMKATPHITPVWYSTKSIQDSLFRWFGRPILMIHFSMAS